MQDVISSNVATINKQMIGTIQSLVVLVDGVSRKSDEANVQVEQKNNRIVNFTADKDLIGEFVDVKITDAWANSLQGEYIGLSDMEHFKVAKLKSMQMKPKQVNAKI